MRKLIVAVITFASFTAFGAMNEPASASFRSTNRTCDRVQTAIDRYGAAIVHYGDGLYDRFVAHQGYCAQGELAEIAWIPATDTDQCPVYHCRAYTGGD